jgi:hypothetical protein
MLTLFGCPVNRSRGSHSVPRPQVALLRVPCLPLRGCGGCRRRFFLWEELRGSAPRAHQGKAPLAAALAGAVSPVSRASGHPEIRHCGNALVQTRSPSGHAGGRSPSAPAERNLTRFGRKRACGASGFAGAGSREPSPVLRRGYAGSRPFGFDPSRKAIGSGSPGALVSGPPRRAAPLCWPSSGALLTGRPAHARRVRPQTGAAMLTLLQCSSPAPR